MQHKKPTSVLLRRDGRLTFATYDIHGQQHRWSASQSSLRSTPRGLSDAMVSRPNEQTPNPESRPGSPSSSSTTARKGAHTHLGLRPKKSDSLHTRIRTSHPQPKHVSKIVDVTSPTLSDPRSRLGSRSSRNASENGFGHSREGTLSRDASVAGESEREEEDGGNDDEEVMTTDIGIYDDKVYDEYLGPLLGTIRRLLIRSLAWETPLLAKHQVSETAGAFAYICQHIDI